MAIYKIFPSADATVYSSYPAKNTGRDEILEISVKNSQDPLRFIERSPLTKSPYYNYDLAVNDNYSLPLNIPTTPDIRRPLLQFSNADIIKLQNFASQSISGSWKASLQLSLATAQNLNTLYTLEAYAVSQSWEMGTGMYANVPEQRNGVCWDYTGPYSGSAPWSGSYGMNVLWQNITNFWNNIPISWSGYTPALPNGGGAWYTYYGATQSFDYMSNKDINMDVTNIVDAWISGSIPNYGIILKHPFAVEESSGSFIDLKFFSVDTHTIYPPAIEFKWADSYYYPQGTNYVLNDQITVTLSNNPGELRQNEVYKMRTAVRNTYPTRQFTTSSVYLQTLYFSEETCWALQDAKTNEMVVDFDSEYTKLSADSVSNYFTLYTSGLEINRYYRILIKTKIYSTTFGPLSVYDNEQSIYNALSLYGPEDLKLLPAEEVIYSGQNLMFKLIG